MSIVSDADLPRLSATPWRGSSETPPRSLACIHPDQSNKERQVFGKQDALVEDNHAPGDLPGAVHAAQHVLALADEDVGLRLDTIAVDEEATAGGHFGRGHRPRRR